MSIRLHLHQGPAELVIEDNGPGFPPDIGSRAFERFVKGNILPDTLLDLRLWMPLSRRTAARRLISDRKGGGAVITLSLPVHVLNGIHATESGCPHPCLSDTVNDDGRVHQTWALRSLPS